MAIIALWDFDDPATVQDDVAVDGAEQDGTYEDGASASGGSLILDGTDDFALIPADPGFQLNAGTLVLEFSPDTVHNGTLVSRDSQFYDGGGHFRLRVESDGSIEVRHQTTSNDEFLSTPSGFYSGGDDIRVTYSWNDDGTGGEYKVENLTTGDTYTEPVPGNLTWNQVGFNEPITLGAAQTFSDDNTANNLEQFFDGSIDYVALFDTVEDPGADIPCYVSGTEIETINGTTLVEDIQAGDFVCSPDGSAHKVLWAGSTFLNAQDLEKSPDLRPIRIKPGVAGNDRALLVSPQHCLAMEWNGTLRFVRAKHLAEWTKLAHVARGRQEVTYHHILLDQHRLILANGLVSESFFPGPESHAMLAMPSLAKMCQALGVFNSADLADAFKRPCLDVLRSQDAMALKSRLVRLVTGVHKAAA